MILKFDAQRVRKLVEHAENAQKHTKSCFDKGDSVPALVLVGSDGVYLASSGIPQPLDDKASGDEPYVAYAEGINPKVDDFNDWWERKRQSFGGDDGFDWLTLDRIKPYIGKKHLCLDVTKEYIGSVPESEANLM